MKEIQIALLVLVAMGGAAVVATREPFHQAIVVGVYGLLLALLFFAFLDPDVSLSQIVVSTVGLPMMILLTISKVRSHEREEAAHRRGEEKR